MILTVRRGTLLLRTKNILPHFSDHIINLTKGERFQVIETHDQTVEMRVLDVNRLVLAPGSLIFIPLQHLTEIYFTYIGVKAEMYFVGIDSSNLVIQTNLKCLTGLALFIYFKNHRWVVIVQPKELEGTWDHNLEFTLTDRSKEEIELHVGRAGVIYDFSPDFWNRLNQNITLSLRNHRHVLTFHNARKN